ncbi:pyrimidine/purine nucleoside phosphorylase [Cobetia amphilecti]|uniref:pyrimidine/purine nucleoside phosphorylase n=1 Tax=Cobetia amphilecti TaxID=1055104 RepID=UPI001CDB2B0F|nr:pyrimidine/purine nucleoside phosphorylase [Cobetia amphilecti]UBU47849.1 pyrimidine/purine nucleoside phosphorylase [Cobetia amphilecti]
MFNINHYFDGQVASIAFQSADLPATVGVMAIGEFVFATSQREYMTLISGDMQVLLPGAEEWYQLAAGESFIVEANQSFEVRTTVESAYLCKYENA